MGEPQYRLEGIVHTRSEGMEDFEGITVRENGKRNNKKPMALLRKM